MPEVSRLDLKQKLHTANYADSPFYMLNNDE